VAGSRRLFCLVTGLQRNVREEGAPERSNVSSTERRSLMFAVAGERLRIFLSSRSLVVVACLALCCTRPLVAGDLYSYPLQ